MLNTDSYAGTCAHTHTKEWRCLVHEWSSQIQKLVVTHITHSYRSFKEVWTWTPVRTQHLHFYLSLYRYWTCWIGLCLLFTPPPPKQTKKDTEEEEVDIATCSRGQYFGELALVTNKPRAASAYAMENVKCLGTVHVTFFCFHPLS